MQEMEVKHLSFTMCQFEYHQFQKCGHKGIEIIEYCNEVFWKAGMIGCLVPCPEQNFRAFFMRIGILDGLDFGSCRWMGLSGYCRICEEEHGVGTTMRCFEFCLNDGQRSMDCQRACLEGIDITRVIANYLQMMRAVPFRTYNDLEFLEGIGDLTAPIFAVKLAEPIAYPNPTQSIQYSSTPNGGVTREVLDYATAMSPSLSNEVTPGIGENLLTRRLKASLHHPYIFAPYIRNTVAGLISVEDQNTPNGLEDLYFPSKLQWYEIDHGVEGTTMQWRSRGYHEGQMIKGAPSQYFRDHTGLTPKDEQYVVNRLKDGVPLQIIWREKFKERGVDLAMFYHYGRKTEQKCEARGVKANSRMEKIQKELVERSRAADGIRPFGTYQQGSDINLQPEGTVDATDDATTVGAAKDNETTADSATTGRTTTANASTDATADDANTRIYA
ncbi:hypothetical protein DSL72_005787 [Monilinia vaccinii-corymbosi]|uniref:Uncharacterized protein n=1 Tax=Monilinia vaccinii-corymbosi TaxID=61207 RepID=A0A8A3PG86_9HELO|nr:hypothetical protein DSL72_005787 [Monilinia vaccinii-corymbosi]